MRKRLQFLALLAAAYLKRLSIKRPILSKKGLLFFWLFLLALVLIKVISPRLITPTVSEGMVGVYNKANLPLSVTNLISDPLVVVDRAGNPTPNLVTSWQVNNDATVYTFKLKDNLYWSDGTMVKSSDIRFDLTDVSIKYLDDQTIEFDLAEPFSPFPTLLNKPIFKEDSLVGISGMKLKSIAFNNELVSKIVLESNEQNLPNVVIRFYPDERTLKTAFELGEVQSMVGVADTSLVNESKLLGLRQLLVHNKVTGIFYNTKDPILSDKNLRLALSLATPKNFKEETAQTPLPNSCWAFNDKTRDVGFNMEKAKAFLDKVDHKGPQLTLTVTPTLVGVGEQTVASWNKLGLNALLRVESGVPQAFQALLISQPIPQDPDQYALWHSTQTKTNLSHYSSPRVDKDLEDARKSIDHELRKERYLDFQKVLLDDSPATFLYFPKLNVVYRKKSAPQLNKVLPLQFPA